MKRKGFTLTELMIVIAVSGVVLAALTTLLVAIVSFQQVRNVDNEITDELMMTENLISDWFSSYDVTSQTALKVQSGNNGMMAGGELEVFFKNDTLSVGDRTYTTKYIEGIAFDDGTGNPDASWSNKDKNLIKCTIHYHSDKRSGEYTFMLLSRSVDPSQTVTETDTETETATETETSSTP